MNLPPELAEKINTIAGKCFPEALAANSLKCERAILEAFPLICEWQMRRDKEIAVDCIDPKLDGLRAVVINAIERAREATDLTVTPCGTLVNTLDSMGQPGIAYIPNKPAATEGPTSETWTKAPEGQVRTCPPGTCRVQSPVPCNCFADPIVAGELAAAKAEVADLAADREAWIKRTLDAEEKLAIVKEEFLQYKSDLDALISRLRKPLVTDNSEGAHE